MAIGPKNSLPAREGRHEHQQRRSWQMKIRQHQIDRSKRVAGLDEQVCLTLEGPDTGFAGCRLERTNRRRPHRDNASSGFPCFTHRGGNLIADIESLLVQAVPIDLFLAKRLEGTRTDMQRDVRVTNSFICCFIEHLLIEVQPRCRCRNRAGIRGINSLVTIRILDPFCTLEIGWQRHFAVPIEIRQRLLRKLLLEHATFTPEYHGLGAAGRVD